LADETWAHMLFYVIDAKEHWRDIAETAPTVIRGARA
jgi:hypothetical protein